ncbi:MAG: hypothetical protein AABW52_00070 [Nanoarchaeota archaeon]
MLDGIEYKMFRSSIIAIYMLNPNNLISPQELVSRVDSIAESYNRFDRTSEALTILSIAAQHQKLDALADDLENFYRENLSELGPELKPEDIKNGQETLKDFFYYCDVKIKSQKSFLN